MFNSYTFFSILEGVRDNVWLFVPSSSRPWKDTRHRNLLLVTIELLSLCLNICWASINFAALSNFV